MKQASEKRDSGKKVSTVLIGKETWQYNFSDSHYDFVIRITDPKKREYSFVRSFYRKGWAKKIRKPFVTSELVRRYISMFIRNANQ